MGVAIGSYCTADLYSCGCSTEKKEVIPKYCSSSANLTTNGPQIPLALSMLIDAFIHVSIALKSAFVETT